MVQYATVADFEARYGSQETLELSRIDSPNETTRDNNALNRRLQDASAIVESYLGIRVLEPPYPTVVVNVTCTIARALLDKNRRREDVQLDYDNAIQWCRDVAKGIVKLPGGYSQSEFQSRGVPELGSADESVGGWYRAY